MTDRLVVSGLLPLRKRGASALLGTIGLTLILLFPVPARGGPLTISPAPTHALGEQAGPQPEANASFGKIPLHFEPNLGQFDPEVQFVARGGSYTAFITAEGVTLAAQQGNCGATRERPGQGKGISPRDHRPEGAEPSRPGPTLESAPCRAEAVKLRIEGRAAGARMVPEVPLEGRSSYFLGSDPSKWRTDVPHFDSIRYEGVYPGVDLVLRPTGTNLRSDFEVGPQADPAQIRLAVEGVESMVVEAGVVVHRTASGSRLEHRALKAAPGSQTVSAAFELDGAGRIRFRVGSWARKEKLVIDPALVWGTFLGGSSSGAEEGRGVAVDVAGNAFVVGSAGSSDFPTTAGAYDTTYNGFMDVFVAKLNPAGSALLYCTLLGGLGDETAGGIAVDEAGNAYVTGTTEGEGFPTTAGAFDTVPNGGPDAFVTKLNPTGTGLVYSTFLGGSSEDSGHRIAVDASGNAFVTGYTYIDNIDTGRCSFPTTAGAYDPTANGYSDAFVTKLNPTGSGLVYSTFLGGSSLSSDSGNGIALGPAGSFFVTGRTSSGDFPVTPGAFDTFPDGSASFIVKFGGYDSVPCGTPTAGSVISTDSRAGHRGSAYYTDFYSLQGAAGQRVTIDLTSAAFDTYLLLVDPAGNVVAQDDNSGGGTNARIGYTFPSAGAWVVEATSWSQLVTGSYALSVQCDCQTLSISPQAVAIGSAASSTSVAVTASPFGCTGGSWTTRANDTWLNVTPTSGSGSGVVTVGWTRNSALLSRTGTATIAGNTFAVMQSAPPCTSFSISPTSIAPGASAGSTRLTVTGNPPGCQDGSWSASSNAATWLSVSPSSSTGSGTVTVTWTANGTGAPRSGTVTVAGGLFAVNQSAGLAFRTVFPCRLLDTRNAAGPFGGPAIQAAGTDDRQFPLLSATCGIPAEARAIAANVTVVTPAAAGDLLVYPADLHELPFASSISFPAGRTRAAMSVLTLPSDGSGIVGVRNSSEGTVHLIIDVNGYFAPAP